MREPSNLRLTFAPIRASACNKYGHPRFSVVLPKISDIYQKYRVFVSAQKKSSDIIHPAILQSLPKPEIRLHTVSTTAGEVAREMIDYLMEHSCIREHVD